MFNLLSSLRGPALVAAFVFALSVPPTVLGQGTVDSDDGLIVESVTVVIENPSPDTVRNERIEAQVRNALAVFPRERLSRQQLEFSVSRARRTAGVGGIDWELTSGATGGAAIKVVVRLADVAVDAAGSGAWISGRAADFPLLYDRDGTYVRGRFDTFVLHYSNTNAWYGRPDLLLDGNPLVEGVNPAGRGYDQWIEAYAHAGLYGITPIGESLYAYGGGSVMTTVSIGQELFNDKTRSYTAWEDAYLGVLARHVDGNGNRHVLNATAGRQRFTLGDGFLVVNTAANGDSRAALQANARWSNDFLGLLAYRYNNAKIEVFRVDPDELPKLDSKTRINGANVEATLLPGLSVAASYLTVPESESGYFLPDGSRLGREGLRVADLRGRWQPGAQGPFVAFEAARQSNSDFDMRARAYMGELGYIFGDVAWSPTVSYRYARFTGDDPETSRYERWDPLLSGGTGEQWVQGANHFKVVQDSNVRAHRVQMRLRPHRRVELVPQFWVFRADSTLNLGGNPALSFLQSRDYGKEVNLTGKLFWSRNLYIHGHLAFTFPGEAVDLATDDTAKTWWSSMLFLRYAF